MSEVKWSAGFFFYPLQGGPLRNKDIPSQKILWETPAKTCVKRELIENYNNLSKLIQERKNITMVLLMELKNLKFILIHVILYSITEIRVENLRNHTAIIWQKTSWRCLRRSNWSSVKPSETKRYRVPQIWYAD